ncbi:MAG: hypothetical protein ACT4P7_06200 [Gemmatimonadaceae bacterium]
MTNPSFEARYQLLKCVAVAEGIRTHNALEATSGRVVMVHLLDAAGPEEVDDLRARLARLPDTDKARVLELATVPAGFALVTEFLQGLTSFPDWLQARVPPEASVSNASPVADDSAREIRQPVIEETPKVSQPQEEPGDFTRLFGQRAVPASPAPPAATPSVRPVEQAPQSIIPPAPPTPAPSAPLQAPTLAPGEFTELFRPAVTPTPGEVAASPFVARAPARGETPRQATPREPMGGPPDQPAFRAPVSSPLGHSDTPLLSSAPSAPPPRRAAPPPPQPVPFVPLTIPPPAAKPASSPGVASPMLGASPIGLGSTASPFASVPPQGGAAAPPLPPVVAPPVFSARAGSPVAGGSGGGAPAGASDYTRFIQQSVTPPPALPTAPKAAATPLAPKKRAIPLGLIIALNVVLVLALALVVYFVLRPSPPAATPGEPLPDAPQAIPKALPKAPAAPKLPAVPKI